MDNEVRAEKEKMLISDTWRINLKVNGYLTSFLLKTEQEADEFVRRINAPNKVDNPAESRSCGNCGNSAKDGAICKLSSPCAIPSGNKNDYEFWQPIKEESNSENTCENCHYMTTECVFTAETGEKCIDKSGWEESKKEEPRGKDKEGY
jgi:hypothetical protein